MTDLIKRQDVIDEISNRIDINNKVLDSLFLGGSDRYALETERNTLSKLKDEIKQMPSLKSNMYGYKVKDLVLCQTKEGDILGINWSEKPESDWQKDYKRTKSYADQLLDEVDQEFHSVWYVVYTDGTTDIFDAELTLELLCEYLDDKKEVRKIEKKEVRKFVISMRRFIVSNEQNE